MDKKIKIGLILLGVYILVFGIGYKSGAMYARMARVNLINEIDKINEMDKASSPPPLPEYFTVTNYNYGSYTATGFECVDDNNVLIKMFKNEKLRPLLKARDMKIYKDTGERIY